MRQLFFILFAFSAFFASAADVELKATLSHEVVNINQRFEVTYSITNSDASQFDMPSFDGFRILSGPNQSRRMQFINGKRSSSSSWSFILLPTREGRFTIDPAAVVVDGKVIQSASLSVTVVNTGGNAQQSAPPANQRQAVPPQQQPSNIPNDQVFIQATVDKREAYVGEKITATYKLYTKVGIADNSLEELPSLNGFWSQDLKSLYDNAQWSAEVINGQRYNSAVLFSTLLYPQRSGELLVDAMSMKMQIQVSGTGNSLFDRMFGSYNTEERIVKSNEVKIKVNALPPKGKPENFSGAVGSFSMEREISTNQLQANNPLELKIIIRGKGNIHLLNAPELDFPADFEVYQPETKDNFTSNTSGISGSRTYEYLAIPRHEGDFLLEPYSFSYFDLASKSYKTISTDTAKIHVEPSAKNPNKVYSSINKEKVELLNKDISYIHEKNLKLRNSRSGFFGSLLFYLLMLVPFMLAVMLFIFRKKRNERRSDVVGLRKSKAKKIATKRLATAQKHLSQSDKTSFHEEISAALFGYYSDKFNLSLSELSQEKILEAMKGRGAGEDLLEKLKKTLDDADMARFAPPSHRDDQAMYQAAEEVIIRSEEELS